MSLYHEAAVRGIADSVSLPALLATRGHNVFLFKGDEGNIKITHAQDIEIFRAILALRNNAYSHYQNLCVQGNKRLVQHGLVILSQGNFSLRIPGTDLICIKPSGVDYATLCPEMIPIVRLDGAVIAGRLKPSVDTPTHLEIYRRNPKITNITHTHSTYATAFAQALLPIPVLGTTHADFCAHDIELVATPSVADMGDYEHATGVAINALLSARESLPPAVLVPHHAPFAFGFKTLDSTENALILEQVAKNSYLSLALNGEAKAPEYLIRKAYERKHGEDAYYGQ
ncbi:MAG: class II aldolase/adducin family protein [Helicobacter sp.]|nr:class II aldolase/adducin family protein [Helicobacter sp.]